MTQSTVTGRKHCEAYYLIYYMIDCFGNSSMKRWVGRLIYLLIHHFLTVDSI